MDKKIKQSIGVDDIEMLIRMCGMTRADRTRNKYIKGRS